ncbi:DUF221-domain-containing protein [Basidiobolus meristosporus CBS 931.73]|uniref:DUF221-domain-containing protein n=1 Tax=Basidiobolus meristosporus CBS 931.73 TaxID=1314790 RepID=A0A1Y1Y798_9FUNG|nr:DUF221-domain-containing protein [Basidiobolus meristosporus CBS 931.73]|eukprot:ORX93606.1 DUF221-domain-containing protein [Basidiobolus meristosporus CBS 931.73]
MDSGNADEEKNGSTESFISSFLFNMVIAGAIYVAYAGVRLLDKSIYQPRTYMVDDEKRPPKLSPNPFSWLLEVYHTPDKVLLSRVGMDAYVFLRFLRMCFYLFFSITVISLVILLPINITGQQGLTGLNRLNIGNVKTTSKLWAHVILDYLFTGLVLYFMNREMKVYLKLRQRYLMSSEHQDNPMSTTILLTGVPDELNNVEKLTEIFSVYPDGVKHAYINRNANTLQADVVKRQQIVEKLEQAEANFIMASLKDPTKPPMRPTHRLGWVPFRGPKVDSIDYYKQELAQMNEKILEQQKDPSVFPRRASAFITFHSQIAAHLAVQALAHNKPLVMEGRYLEVDPNEVIWENLNMFSLERYIRKAIAVACGASLVVLWFFPVSFVAAVFSFDRIAQAIPALKNIQWNPVVLGVVKGILPPLGMAILMALLPIILALLSRFEGLVRNSDIQVAVMDKYFFFLVINVFLFTTLAISALTEIEGIIKDISKLFPLLGSNIPVSSTFYMNYVMLNGISGGVKELLQAVPFVLRFVLTSLLPKTPRKLINLKSMPQIEWGTFFPQHTFVFVLGIVYATISPIFLIFVSAYFLITYFVYHHQFQYVYDSSHFQSGGLLLPKAIYHMFVGLYIYHLTMAGVVLAKNAYAQFIMQLVLLGITIVANLYGSHGYGPLIKYLPVNIAKNPALVGLLENHVNTATVNSDSSLINMQELDKKQPEEKHQASVPMDNTFLRSARSTMSFGTQMSRHKVRLPPIYNNGPDAAFLHPALREPVPVVWLPKDTLGIADKEAYSLAKTGQPATTEGSAINDANGKISISAWTAPSLLNFSTNTTNPGEKQLN